MKLYNIREEYIDYLRTIDEKVPQNKGEKRPFVGIVFSIDRHTYFAPLSSPKPKHQRMKNALDFHKIDKSYGVINFNNMIPVPSSQLLLIDISGITNATYKTLLQNQHRYIKQNQEVLEKKARNLYNLSCRDIHELSAFQLKVKGRCVDFKKIQKEYINFK